MADAIIEATEPVEIPATITTVYDRWKIPRIELTEDPITLVRRADIIAAKGNATTTSDRPQDRVNIVIPNLLAEFANDPEALQWLALVEQLLGGLITKALVKRGVK